MSSMTSSTSQGGGRVPPTGSAADPVPESGAEATRRRLLDAAETLFAEQGFTNTPVRDVTNAAGSNLASVNYHFGGKDNLYVAVWQRMLADMRRTRLAAIDDVMRQADPQLDQLVRALAVSLVQPMIDSPRRGERMMQLYTREMSQPRLPEGMFVREMVEPVAARVADSLTRLMPGLDRQQAVLCLFSLAGQLLHLLQMKRLFGEGPLPEELTLDIDAAVDHIVRFTVAGIRDIAEHQS